MGVMRGLRRLAKASAAMALAAGAAWIAAAAALAAPPDAAPSALVRVAAYGRVQPDPDRTTSIALPHAGLVQRLWVRLGQRVEAGDPLLTVTTAPAAQVAYQQARAAVDSARSQLGQTEKLFHQNLATHSQVADARRRLRDAQSQLQAQERLGTGNERQVIHAPFAGIVTQLSVSQGQRVQADTAALQLAGGGALVVPLGVELEDVARVQRGQPVTLSPVFRPGMHLKAEVYEVHAMVDPQTHLVDVLVRVSPQEARQLVIGETLGGSIVVRSAQALAVPRSAVLQDAGGAYVFTVRGGHAHRVAVATGLQADGWVAVAGSLTAGDAVVVVGNYELRDGMAVRESGP